MTKYAGHDTTLGVDYSGGTAYAVIAQVVDIGGPNMSRNPIDVTTRDSTNYWREFLKGFKDGGEVTFNVIFDPGLAGHASAAGLLSDFNEDGVTLPAWQMTFADATAWTFNGFLSGQEVGQPLDDALTMDVTLKISGAPTLA